MMKALLVFGVMMLGSLSYAQAQMPIDTSNRVEIIHADKLSNTRIGSQEIRRLKGDVHLIHKDIVLFCDSAIIYQPDNRVEAFGNVNIQQADSINIFADSAYYFGTTRKTTLNGHVELSDSRATLATNKLFYNLNTRQAEYFSGATIDSDSSRLTSVYGLYDVNTKVARFRKSVRLDDPDVQLTSDTLDYNTETEVATFRGPTYIFDQKRQLYCEDGFYDTQKNVASFLINVRYSNNDQLATANRIDYEGASQLYTLAGDAFFQDSTQSVSADTSYYNAATGAYSFRGNSSFQSLDGSQSIQALYSDYNSETGQGTFRGDVVLQDNEQLLKADSLDFNRLTHFGSARGNVFFSDSAANLTVSAIAADFNDSTGYLLAYGRPLMTTVIESDTVYICADTLRSFRENPADTVNRTLLAYHSVIIFKSDLQGKCDSLSYRSEDSTFQLLQTPRLWSDSTQFTADTISILLKNEAIDQVLLRENSFIIQTNDTLFFNQIKGRDITAAFKDNDISTMRIEGNAETVYYLQDDSSAYIGVNEVISSDMFVVFENNQAQRITFYTEPQATLFPMGQVNHTKLRRRGFKWLEAQRPKSKAEVK